MTVTEIVACTRAGAEIVKLFPGDAFTPEYIKAIRGPLPDVQLMPTGGVTLDNVGDWIKAGAVAVGVGGNLTAGAKTGDYELITSLAKKYMAIIVDSQCRD
jgi:2-dehydro-3-deoxyphosphogluconate aldolase/(4S)-4-hydroxy-2-oxoglutarate aldolase